MPLLATFKLWDCAPQRIQRYGQRLISLKNNSSLITIPLCIVRRILLQTWDKHGANLDVQLLPLSPISDTPPPSFVSGMHEPKRTSLREPQVPDGV